MRTGTSITILQNGQSHTLPIRRDLPAARIQSFLVDSRGQLWIGTSKGLFTLDNISSHPQAVPALSSDSILSLMQDEEGNLWVGTETSGLQILRHKNFRAIPALFGLPITAITQASDGALWAGTSSDGLDRWQAGTVQHLSTHTGLLSETILALAPEENGSMWVGTPTV
ncbi:two-component regulator propeller domain-containing protein [Tunturiibacter empetritectus]|uniref:ligand-binding sensor domain-containing protein n=1 Tax=Tunturiibacter empetritectus TaxID=3069691 RepID=UPI003D9B78B9